MVTVSVLRLRLPLLMGLFAVLLLSGAGPLGSLAAAEKTKPKVEEPDELVFADGDRASGKFLKREEGVIVFQTKHFGEVRVKESDVKLVLAAPPVEPEPKAAVARGSGAAPKVPAAQPPAEEAQAVGEDAEEPTPWYALRSSDLAKSVRAFFGPWKGRIALSTEVVTNSNERSAIALDSTMQRKWKRDEVKLSMRYDYAETNDVTSTDMLRGDATWNHSLGSRFYTVYSPKGEWNKRFKNSGGEIDDYVMLQQEFGLGWSVHKGRRGKVAVGLSENFFNVWVLDDNTNVSRRIESMFVDTEWKLPWQITLTDRGQMYPTSEGPGWENRFQANKKLSDTLSIGLSHELRRKNPDVRVADYTKMKVMFGLEF